MNLPVSPEMLSKVGWTLGGAVFAALVMLSLSGQPFSTLKVGLTGLEATFQSDEIASLKINYEFCKAELESKK